MDPRGEFKLREYYHALLEDMQRSLDAESIECGRLLKVVQYSVLIALYCIVLC